MHTMTTITGGPDDFLTVRHLRIDANRIDARRS